MSGGAGLEADCEEESVDEEECGDEEGDNETESGSSDSDKSEIGEVEDEEGESEGENDEDDEDEGGEIDMTGNSSEQRPPLIETALELLFGLIMAFSTEEVVDGRPASTLLVFFSGVLGFSADSTSFLPARSYISNLAALIYVQRLLFLEYALPARGYPRNHATTPNRLGRTP